MARGRIVRHRGHRTRINTPSSAGTFLLRKGAEALGSYAKRKYSEYNSAGGQAGAPPVRVQDAQENKATKNLVGVAHTEHAGTYRSKKYSKSFTAAKRRKVAVKFKKRKSLLKIIKQKKPVNTVYENYSTAYAGSNGVLIVTDPTPLAEGYLKQWPVPQSATQMTNMLSPGYLQSTTSSPYFIDVRLVRGIGWIDDGIVQTVGADAQEDLKAGFYYTAHATTSFRYEHLGLMDVYECVAADDISDTSYKSPYDAWNHIQTTGRAFQGETTTTVDRQTATPFESHSFGKYWKIIRTTRFQMQPGAWTPYTYSTRGYYNNQKVYNNYAIKGQTKALLFILNAATSGTNQLFVGGDLSFHVNRKFKFWTDSIDGSTGMQRLPTSTYHSV